jgi:hypothetical protein
MNASSGYTAFPVSIAHPSRARRFSPEEFATIPKKKLQDGPSVFTGHAGTTVWYVEQLGYIIEIRFDFHPSVHIHSICTVAPTFGMDMIDGEFAQDAEEHALHEVLGYQGQRLSAFPADADIPTNHYLRMRGYIK